MATKKTRPAPNWKLSDHGLLTIAEAANRIGYTPRAIQKWIEEGLITFALVGGGRGTMIVLATEIDQFTPPQTTSGMGRPWPRSRKKKPRAS